MSGCRLLPMTIPIPLLILLCLLAIPGVYLAVGSMYVAFLSLTTNINTGETKPGARGLGWALIGGAVVAAVCFVHEVWK